MRYKLTINNLILAHRRHGMAKNATNVQRCWPNTITGQRPNSLQTLKTRVQADTGPIQNGSRNSHHCRIGTTVTETLTHSEGPHDTTFFAHNRGQQQHQEHRKQQPV
jgi:hypothetical protein